MLTKTAGFGCWINGSEYYDSTIHYTVSGARRRYTTCGIHMSLKSQFVSGRAGKLEMDTIGAWVGLAIAIALFPLRFSVSQLHVHTIPIVLGLASGLYLVLKHHEYRIAEIRHWRISSRPGHVLSMIALVGLGCMIFVGTYTGGRTPEFYGVAAVVGTLILAQIFFLQRTAVRPGVVLAEIVAFALIVRWLALLTTPGLIGVDSWIHIPDYAHSIRETGQLSAIAESHYYGVPLYHLLVVVAAEAFNTSLRMALYVTLGFVVPLSMLLIYYTSRFFLPVRWALFATATFSFADHVVRWGIHLIPTSMGLVFFLGVFYGVARLSATKKTSSLYALVLIFALATVYTHHISTFVVLVFLGAGAVAQIYTRLFAPGVRTTNTDAGGGTVNFLLLLVVVLPVTLVTWSLTPRDGSFLDGMIGVSESSIFDASFLDLASTSGLGNEVIKSMATSVPLSIRLFDLLGFLLLLFVTLLGAFTLLQREYIEQLTLSWINSTGLMLFVVLGTPMFGLYFLVPNRWYAFAYVPMVLLGAFGMQYIESNLSARKVVAVMVLFALLFPGAMLVNEKATHDNPIAPEYHQKFAYSESELAAAQTIATIHPEEESLHTDHPYFIYLRDANGVPAESLALTEDGTISDTNVVHRDYQAMGSTGAAYDGRNVQTSLTHDEVCRPGMDVIYSIGDVQYCRTGA